MSDLERLDDGMSETNEQARVVLPAEALDTAAETETPSANGPSGNGPSGNGQGTGAPRKKRRRGSRGGRRRNKPGAAPATGGATAAIAGDEEDDDEPGGGEDYTDAAADRGLTDDDIADQAREDAGLVRPKSRPRIGDSRPAPSTTSPAAGGSTAPGAAPKKRR